MAVTIKLKNASGSDPTASDLVVGEVAIRTDTGKLFTKKDDNSVAEISGGGIDDGDKGDITVSSSGATFTIDNDVVTFAKMQNVSTSRLLGRTTSSSGDIEELTASAVRTLLNVADGATNVTNTNQLTNGAGFITATLTNEQVQDIVGGMVSGNTESGITVTYQDGDGTLDFSVASQTDNNFTDADHSKLDGIAAGANNVTNNNQLTNGAGYITDLVSDTSPQLGGDLDLNGNDILLDDNEKIFIGTSNDGSLFNSGSFLFLKNHSGGVAIQGTSTISLQKYDNSDIGLQYTVDGSIALYHDNSKKVETSSSGVTVTGTCTATAFSGDGSSLTGISATVAGGAVYENAQSITSNYTVTNGKNAMSAGPIEIASGVTVTIGSGETYTIV